MAIFLWFCTLIFSFNLRKIYRLCKENNEEKMPIIWFVLLVLLFVVVLYFALKANYDLGIL